jgi:hypothetical protein
MNTEESKTQGQEVTPEEVRPKRNKKLQQIKKMKVAVAQDDIDKAIRGNTRKCMIERSIERDYPTLKNVVIEKNTVRFTDPDRNVIYTFDMAPVGRAAILMWDDGGHIAPFAFTLRHPVVRQRARRKDGYMHPKPKEDSAIKSLGAVPMPRTKEARALRGRDRFYGAKLWTQELATLRSVVSGESQPACPA